MTETQVEGTMIPEAVPVEGIVPEAEVLEGAGSEPDVTIAPEATDEVRDDVLPESRRTLSSGRWRSKMRSRSVRR
jgi:hypothetical protein